MTIQVTFRVYKGTSLTSLVYFHCPLALEVAGFPRLQSWRMLVVALVALASVGFMAASATVAADPRPNIVMLLLDDWGWANLGVHNPGNPEVVTPNIDALIAEGAAAGACLPVSVGASLHVGFASLRRHSSGQALRVQGRSARTMRSTIYITPRCVCQICSPSRCALQSGRNPIHVNG